MNRKFLLTLLVLTITITFAADVFSISLNAKPGKVKSEPGIPMAATPCVAGMAGIYPCNNIDLLAFVPVTSMGCTAGSGLADGNTVEGWVDPTTNKEYAIMGCNNGTSFLDVTDPENPVYLGHMNPATSNSAWRDLRVYSDGSGNHRLYVGSEAGGHGIQVFDLTRLRGITTPQTFTHDAHYTGLGNSHTIFLNHNTGFLYAVGSGGGGNVCTSGLHMLNVQSLQPTFAGCFGNGIYTHEVTCATYNGPDTQHNGKEICFAANGPTEQIVISDVTNKSAPVQLSAKTYTGSFYPHQVWFTEDFNYLLLNDELDEDNFNHNTKTYIWDITDLDNPVLIDDFVHSTTAIDHNLYVKGNLVYESNYTAGLRVFNLNNVGSGVLTEVAYFDIWPQNNNSSFDGTWDNYPYLPSGIVLVSGIKGAQTGGLFILQPTLTPDFALSAADEVLNTCDGDSAQTTIELEAIFNYNGNVSMSTIGLPGGVSAGFNPNPAAVPGSTELTLSVSGTPTGNYPFSVSATDGTVTHTLPLTLNVANVASMPPQLLEPANNATDQQFIIHFEWVLVDGASSYDLEIATDASFTNIIYSVNTTEEHHTATEVLDPETTYFWRMRANNACGSSAWSAVFQFTTGVPANVLLVDDDNNNPDVRQIYIDALTANSETYNIWSTDIHTINAPQDPKHADEPDATTMNRYDVVIWFSGDASGGVNNPQAGPNESSETALAQYLDNGGCLAIISEEYFNDRGDTVTSFMSEYLGVATIMDNQGQTSVTGSGIFSGIPTSVLQYPTGVANFSDRLFVGTGAQIAFSGNAGVAAISKATDTYRTIYMGFPFEALPGAIRQRDVMERILDFCAGLNCPEITLSPSTLPDGGVGSGYNQTVTASGGVAPYTFSITAGSLPTGLTFNSNGSISGTPSAEGTFNFTVQATDSNGCTGSIQYSITIADEPCLFCDDFEDGVIAANWNYVKPDWSETGGQLIGVPAKRKAIAIASPAFAGCTTCSIQTSVTTSIDSGSRVWVLGWYTDKRNTMELLLKPENGVWVLKQRSNGAVVKKQKVSLPINSGQAYNVQLSFNGTQFEVFVDGVVRLTMTPAGSISPGTVGFQVKNTSASFGEINVN